MRFRFPNRIPDYPILFTVRGGHFVAKTAQEEQVRRLHKALTAACHEAQFQSQTLASGSEPAPPMTLVELERF